MRKLIFVSLLLLIGLSAQAQAKYGYVNLGNLISEMPAAKAADQELQVYQQELIEVGQAMAADFEKKYRAFAKAVQDGTLPPVKQAEQEKALGLKQQEIANYEQQIRADMEVKRTELLKPIIAEAQKAINDVAKENNIQLVFDTSIFGAIMFAEESQDLMSLVKAKLNM